MSELIDQIYDKMSLREVMFRLPGRNAIDAIKRRIKSPDQLKEIFEVQDRMAVRIPEIKEHINSIISTLAVDSLLDSVESEKHRFLFSWLNDENSKRIMDEGKDKLSIEFLFNLTDSKDIDGLKSILNRILSDTQPKLSKVSSVLNKIDKQHFTQLVEIILNDKRDYIKTSILATRSESFKLITEVQKMVAVKALARVPSSCESPKGIQSIDFKLFKTLKPLERIMALDKYLDYFPKYKKIKVFNPVPTEDEFNMILFAGCFEYNDLVEKLVQKYKDITENEKSE